MAVFTYTNYEVLSPWLKTNYDIELAIEPEAISEGIENTNYKITAKNGKSYVFTVIEVWDQDISNYCLKLAHHLNDAKLPVPLTLSNLQGVLSTKYADKPAAVVSFIEGEGKLNPSEDQCKQMGQIIAKFHTATKSFALDIHNQRGYKWRIATAKKIMTELSLEEQKILEHAQKVDISMQQSQALKGACHCDLFRNNVLWNKGKVAAVIDFYFSGNDHLSFDLAVAAVDWTIDTNGNLDINKLAALCYGYQAEEQNNQIELLSQTMVTACLRFWLSRYLDILKPREALALKPHNPVEFLARLKTVIAKEDEIRDCIKAVIAQVK